MDSGLVVQLSVGTGFILGILRYVLDDKWNALPKSLCRFCTTFWASVVLMSNLLGYMLICDYSILYSIIAYACAVAVATVTASFSYVYIKNANL